jgi:hypothetical protein
LTEEGQLSLFVSNLRFLCVGINNNRKARKAEKIGDNVEV